jgi:phosphate:Na+ symporter
VLRDLKRIHSHICSVAYPGLEIAGELQPNRLKDSDSAAAVEPAPLMRGELPADSRPS